LTPRLQLRACIRRSRAGDPRHEERRTGAAPRCSGVLGRAQRSKLDPLTPVLRSSVSPTGRADSTVPPSRDTPSSSLRRLPSTGAPCVACATQNARHRPRGFAAAGSASCASPLLAFAWMSWACRASRGSPPRRRAGQALLSTSATTTVLQHDHGSTDPPRTTPGVASMTLLRAAVRWISRTHDRPSGFRARGHRGRKRPRQRLPSRSLAGELCPDPIGSGTSCHGFAPCAGRRATRREQGRIPAKPPASHAKRRSHKGCRRSPSAKRGVSRAPEVPSIDGQP
jgi:hypothetical protein